MEEHHQRLPLEEAFGDEVSGDIVQAPAPLPQRAPPPVMESTESDHGMSSVEELVEALSRPFTVSLVGYILVGPFLFQFLNSIQMKLYVFD